jgi:hypothetical protein
MFMNHHCFNGDHIYMIRKVFLFTVLSVYYFTIDLMIQASALNDNKVMKGKICVGDYFTIVYNLTQLY